MNQEMSFAQELHQAHKARIARMAGAAAKVAEPKPAEIRRAAVKQSWPMPKAVRPLAASEANGPVPVAAVPAPAAIGYRIDLINATVRQVVGVAARNHNLGPTEVMSVSRRREVVAARGQAMFLIFIHKPKWSVDRIGKCFNRDHSTVSHALARHLRAHPELIEGYARCRAARDKALSRGGGT